MTCVLRRAAILSLAALALGACDGPAGSDTVDRIELSPATALVPVNTTATLQATARTAGGNAMTGVAFTWASSDTSVATVSAEGVVTARRLGDATVTASAGGTSGSTTVRVTGTPGGEVVSGLAEDTIFAVVAEPLVVEVRDQQGLLSVGERVVFEALEADTARQFSMFFRVPPPFNTSSIVFGTTDGQGRASAQVIMGGVAGRGRVVISSETRGVLDTAYYTIRPGAPARVRLAPGDSGVFRGRAVQLRAAVADRAGNAVASAVAYRVLDGPLTVDPATGLVGTPAYGSGHVVATAGIGGDTVRVRSLPEGALAAGGGFGTEVLVMNLDGTSGRMLPGPALHPAWSPSGDRIATQSNAFGGVLQTQGLSGAPVPLIGEATTNWHQWPQYSRDGAWIYYFTAAPNEPQALWRVRPDGSGRERVSTGTNYMEGHPSPSPDGTRVAFFVGGGSQSYIRVRDLRTGQETGNLTRGHSPTWSPTAELIAFNALREGIVGTDLPTGIMVMKPDGSGLRRVSPDGYTYNFSPRWSPDGRWIIASSNGEIQIIEVETGLMIPIAAPSSFESVDWKPGGLLP